LSPSSGLLGDVHNVHILSFGETYIELGHASDLFDNFHFGGHLNPSDGHLFLHLKSASENSFLSDFGFGLHLRFNDGHFLLICDETYFKMVNAADFLGDLGSIGHLPLISNETNLRWGKCRWSSWCS
jgi:hypothetical protein